MRSFVMTVAVVFTTMAVPVAGAADPARRERRGGQGGGVAVLNGRVLVDRVRQLLDRGVPLTLAVREALVSRLSPVRMTAAVASLGFVPIALATRPEAEVQRPLATVVIGGVLSAMALTLLVMPVLFTAVRACAGSERGDEGDGTGTPFEGEQLTGDASAARAVAMRWEGP